jgi:hypothetical protein
VQAAPQLIYDAASFSHQNEFDAVWKTHDKVEAKKEAEELHKLAAEDLVAQPRALPMDCVTLARANDSPGWPLNVGFRG